MMLNIDQSIREICKRETSLNEIEIDKIIEVSKSIQFMADFYESDVFVDVHGKKMSEAFVVAHSMPENKSLYSENIAGKPALQENEPGVIEVFRTGNLKRDIKALTQEYKLVKQTIQPINLEDKIIGVIIVEKDISEDLKEDFSIMKSVKDTSSYNFINLFKNNDFFIDNLNSSILVFDENGYLKLKNKNAEELYRNLGFTDDIIDNHYDWLTLENDEFEAFKDEDYETKEVYIGDMYLSIKSIPIKDGVFKLAKVIQNVTELKKKEAELVLKSVAVKEAHHRVKNNLYTVISLLRKQSRLSKNEEVKSCLDNTVNRVFAILSTHYLLSKEVDNKISIKDAIDLLISNIQGGYSDNKDINIYISGDDFEISGDKATSLLLVMNEIIQNCFDHAFEGRDCGNIQILINQEEKFKNIAIADDGIGLDESKVNNDSLGTFIIESYVQQVLKGEIVRQSNKNGTKVLIKIPKQITNLQSSSFN
jgi:two-component sensor histidine kinase